METSLNRYKQVRLNKLFFKHAQHCSLIIQFSILQCRCTCTGVSCFVYISLTQLQAAASQQLPAETLGLGPGSPLLSSIRKCVVALSGSSGVLSSVQRAAQEVLRGGWTFLLPTVSERASALSELLPSGEGMSLQASLKMGINLCYPS